MIAAKEFSLMSLVGNKPFCCGIAGMTLKEKPLRLHLWLVEVLCPAVVGQHKRADVAISCLSHLFHLIIYSVNLRICLVPKLLYLLQTLVAKPRSLANGNPTRSESVV